MMFVQSILQELKQVKSHFNTSYRGSAIVETMAAVGLGMVIIAGLARITTRSVNFNTKMHDYYDDFRDDMGERSQLVAALKAGEEQVMMGEFQKDVSSYVKESSAYISVLTTDGASLAVESPTLSVMEHDVIKSQDRAIVFERGSTDFKLTLQD